MKNSPLSYEEYMILVEQAPIMIWRSDRTMACDYFNQKWLEFTGRTMEQERGNGWAEGVHKEDFDRCLEIYVSSFKERRVFEMEYRLRRRDGEYRWIFDRGTPYHDEAGNFAGYIGSCVDITEKVEARKMLLEARDSEIRKLRGMLPICSACKKIRDDQGYWQQIETYISEHSGAAFTHGICPSCAERLYPGYLAKNGQDPS